MKDLSSNSMKVTSFHRQLIEKAEGRRQKAEVKRQKAEIRNQKTEDISH